MKGKELKSAPQRTHTHTAYREYDKIRLNSMRAQAKNEAEINDQMESFGRALSFFSPKMKRQRNVIWKCYIIGRTEEDNAWKRATCTHTHCVCYTVYTSCDS